MDSGRVARSIFGDNFAPQLAPFVVAAIDGELVPGMHPAEKKAEAGIMG